MGRIQHSIETVDSHLEAPAASAVGHKGSVAGLRSSDAGRPRAGLRPGWTAAVEVAVVIVVDAAVAASVLAAEG